MALNFTTTITIPSGIEVANAYGRVSVLDDKAGDSLQAGLAIFASEQAFLDGKEAFNMPQLAYAKTAYDRTTDGTDLLNIAHDLLITELAAVGITATKNL